MDEAAPSWEFSDYFALGGYFSFLQRPEIVLSHLLVRQITREGVYCSSHFGSRPRDS